MNICKSLSALILYYKDVIFVCGMNRKYVCLKYFIVKQKTPLVLLKKYTLLIITVTTPSKPDKLPASVNIVAPAALILNIEPIMLYSPSILGKKK